ncbi:MAG: FAD-dependent oxidoreductase [Alphaproteobacteria bacterium]|nr:FAD-dependent oxidoreductase [Alphaproteobacteria bacterium]
MPTDALCTANPHAAADLPPVIVGAGPAGVRAAEALLAAGLAPILIDEGAAAGGRIYQRQPPGFTRDAATLHGTEAGKATALHTAFDAIAARIDWRPGTLVWAVRPGELHLHRDGRAETLPFRDLILATGAMDRLIPLPGWTLPGVFSLGGAQIALKTQAVAIGRQVAFVGTGPLLWLLAHQYRKAGGGIAAVIDTTPSATKRRQILGLLTQPGMLARGLSYMLGLRRAGVRIVEGAMPEAILGEGRVQGLRWRDARGRVQESVCDAVAMGWHLRPEAQLAELAGVPFRFNPRQRNWEPDKDPTGRTAVPGVYLAGDGAGIEGADAAEIAGARAALSLLQDRGRAVDAGLLAALDRRAGAMLAFRHALDAAFPFPHALAAGIADDVMVCRCEAITAGELRAAVDPGGAMEINRAKAFSRLGMGRCQGRVCAPAAAEIIAARLGAPVEAVGRLRAQAPVKPLPAAARSTP